MPSFQCACACEAMNIKHGIFDIRHLDIHKFDKWQMLILFSLAAGLQVLHKHEHEHTNEPIRINVICAALHLDQFVIKAINKRQFDIFRIS